MPESAKLTLHEDIALFVEVVNFTASQTGFNSRLIEKDYFCTVLLEYLAKHGDDQLVFKGGTCLAKVYADFYRLSEDLDFTIPLAVDANRTQRRQAVSVTRDALAALTDHLNSFTITRPLTGANNSTQYNGTVEYESPTTGQPESILIEISIREPLLMEAISAEIRTLLLDPVGGQAMAPAITTNCIDMNEAMAEKFRAAMSRRDAAIRDLYDLDYAVSHLGLDPTDPDLIDMVRRKLNVPGNSPVDVGAQRLADMKRQLNTRLRTVLQDKEFQTFDLDHAFGLITSMAERLA
jgi:predicted nucleotidyltransferase component of viral defense system